MRRHSRRKTMRRRLAYGAPLLLAPAIAGAAMRFLRRRRRASEGAETVGPARGETTPQPGAHSISLHRAHDGERFDEALAALRDQLGARAVGEPDGNGFFEVEVQAESWDAATGKVRDAVAAAGADDVIELGEPSGRVER